jgi:hypothetical protein
LNRHISKEEIQIANDYIKTFNILSFREMQITIVRCHLTLVRMTIIKKTTNASEDTGKKELPYDPAIPLLDIYPKESNLATSYACATPTNRHNYS